jgi:hypothetical protein
MTRKIPLTVFAAVQCLVAAVAFTAPAQAAATIPPYFFGQWTVTANCTELSAGGVGQVQPGLQYKIASTPASNGAYALQIVNTAGQHWGSGWSGLQLHYRPGARITSVPADFECVAGAEAAYASASPLLAMSGYVQTPEPQFPQEHWYGLANINGQYEHVLVFPVATQTGGTSAVIVLESATGDSVALDVGGVISSR